MDFTRFNFISGLSGGQTSAITTSSIFTADIYVERSTININLRLDLLLNLPV